MQVACKGVLATPGCVQSVLLFQRDKHDAGVDHAERARRVRRYVDHASLDEGPAVVDPAVDGVAAVGDGDHAAERSRPVRACHLAGTADAFIKRGKTAFGFGAWDDRNESKRSEERAIHGRAVGALRPPDKFRSIVPVPRNIFHSQAAVTGTFAEVTTRAIGRRMLCAGLRGFRCAEQSCTRPGVPRSPGLVTQPLPTGRWCELSNQTAG